MTEPLEKLEPLRDLPDVRPDDVMPLRDLPEPLERTALTDDDLVPVLVPATVVRLKAENPLEVALRPAVTNDLEPRELVGLVGLVNLVGFVRLVGLVAEKPLLEGPFRDLPPDVLVLVDSDGAEGLAERFDLLCDNRLERDLLDPSEPRVEKAPVARGAKRIRDGADNTDEAAGRDLTA